MKKKIVVMMLLASMFCGVVSAAGASYFYFGGLSEDLKQEFAVKVAEASGDLDERKQELDEFADAQIEDEKKYVRKTTQSYFDQRKEQAMISLGKEQEIEASIDAEADEIVAEVNKFIDKSFADSGF